MKRLLPILLLIGLLSAQLNAGNTASVKKITQQDIVNQICDLDAGNLSIGQVNPDINYPSDMSQSTLSVPIGQAGNLFTIIRGTSNMVDADEDLNTVVFIHRGDPNTNSATSTSNYNIDISTTGGNTWLDTKINVGPLNYNPGQNIPNGQARYPQMAIYNPDGNTDPNSAYAVFLGATHDGVSANIWDGYAGGSLSLNSADTTVNSSVSFTEVVNYGNVLIPNSLTERIPGSYTALDWEFNGTDFDELIYYSLETDGTNTTVDYSLVPISWDESFDGTSYGSQQHIDWASDGLVGYISWIGDIGTCTEDYTRSYVPCMMTTNDGGATWTDPSTFDMNNFDGFIQDYKNFVIDTLGNTFETGLTASFLDSDVAVDANGDFYYLLSWTALGGVYSVLEPYTIYASEDGTVTPFVLTLLHYSIGTETWEIIKLTDIESPSGQDIVPTFNNFQRSQLSVSPDGTKLFVTYLDAPVDSSLARPYRDLRGIGYDISTGLTTPVKEFTFGDPVWTGNAFYHTASPDATIDANNDYRVPSVFTEIPLDEYNPVQFHYIRDVIFSDGEFTETPEISNYSPDPASADSFTATPDATVSIEYTFEAIGSDNACGYTWDFGDGSTASGQSVDYAFDNMDGTYTVCLTVSNDDGGETICQDITVSAFLDTEPPVITLLGDNPFTIYENQTFNQLNDPGYQVSDNFDAVGDIDVDVDYSAVDGSTPGTYNVTYTATDQTGNPATAIREVIVEMTIGIEDNIAESIQLLPNPTKGQLNINYPDLQIQSLEIYNILGAQVLQKNLLSGNNTELNLTEFDSGIYMIRFHSNEGIVNKKLIIE